MPFHPIPSYIAYLLNSLTVVVVAQLHNASFGSNLLWLTLKLLYMCLTQYLCATVGNNVSITGISPGKQTNKTY